LLFDFEIVFRFWFSFRIILKALNDDSAVTAAIPGGDPVDALA
jgi:hypothetical protein